MEFSERLRQLRTEKGVSQAKLAEEIHISRSAVAKWENGLGLPGEESLKFLAEYFEMSVAELLSDKENQRALVEKNKTIAGQNWLIIVLICLIGAGLMLISLANLEQLSLNLEMSALGLIFCILGAFNIKGNIASIHWYNRRKVTKENQLPYCRLMGLGTLITGLAVIAASAVQAVAGVEAGALVTLGGVTTGFALMLYAQIKYNKGIF